MHSVSKDPDLAAKTKFLSRTDSYPEATGLVEVVETHRSLVFLTDQYAYKLKKPVRGEAFDFSTLDARRQNCHHEVRLNRRLAENVYLCVVAITMDGTARLSIEGDGEPVEWLVKMRKLNRDRMLDRCIATVTPQEIESVGRLLAAFYSQAAPAAWSGAHYCRYLAAAISDGRVALLKHSFGLPLAQIDTVAVGLCKFIDSHRAELIQRVRDGRIIDAHGDLRPEHICLESPPVIIDCLEFNHDLRILDTASEMSFLTQECELLGAPEIGQQLWRDYAERTHDCAANELRRFYAGYHAFLRASLAIAHLLEQDILHPEKWKAKAQRYLDIAGFEFP